MSEDIYQKRKTSLTSGKKVDQIKHDSGKVILPIDHSKSLEEMISLGNYIYDSDDFPKYDMDTVIKFFSTKKGIKKVEEYEFTYYTHPFPSNTKQILEAISNKDKKHPWEPAKAEHLLHFGNKFQYKQYKHSIIALGSIAKINDAKVILCLSGPHAIAFDFYNLLQWKAKTHFLIVRKVK